MTILEPTLYANGALRLTRHGAGRGGNILVLEVDGHGATEQVEISDDGADRIDDVIGNLARRHQEAALPRVAFNHIASWFRAR